MGLAVCALFTIPILHNYHYVRTQKIPREDNYDLLIAGGEDHKTGETEDLMSANNRFDNLYTWTTEKFSVKGTVTYNWSGQVLEPTDLSIDTNHDIMYLADKNNNRIQKFKTDGNYIASWGSRGSKVGQFLGPADLAVDYSSNLIFVADLGNNRIQKFDTNGNFADTWGSFGKGFGQFEHVGDVALDTKGKFVYVTDIGNHRVQKFDYEGKFISSWGSLGTGEGRFDRPAGVDYDSSGIVYVVDTNNNRIQKFDTEGDFLGMWGEFGKGPGQFDNPVSLNIDPTSDYLYVSDSGNKRIQIFDHNGKYLGAWGTDGGDDGEFERPVSVAFGPNGKIFVMDKDRGDIQIFANGESNSALTTKTSTKQRTTSEAEGNMTGGCFGEQNCKEYCETTPCVEETSGPSTTTDKRYDRTVQFSADLRGENEVPPTDSEASGTASFSVNKGVISYRIKVTGMDEEPVTGAHLHTGREGSNGEVVVTLATDNHFPAEGSISSSDLEGPLEGKTIGNLVNLMKKGSIYVNLHSNIFPDGELRGQVK